MTNLTYEQMVEYVSATVSRIEGAVQRMARDFRDHETYHRELLTRELNAVRSARFAWLSVIVAGLAAVASLIVAVVALTGHG